MFADPALNAEQKSYYRRLDLHKYQQDRVFSNTCDRFYKTLPISNIF